MMSRSRCARQRCAGEQGQQLCQGVVRGNAGQHEVHAQHLRAHYSYFGMNAATGKA